MPEGTKMSNGTPPLPARPDDDAVDPRWLSPPEQAPQSPRDKDCEHNGFGNPALPPSNGSPPTPSPPMSMSCCILPSRLMTAVVKIAMTSTPQTTFSRGSLFGFSPYEDHSAAVCHLDVMISLWSITVAHNEWIFESAVRNLSPSVMDRYAAWQNTLARLRSFEARRSRHQAVLSLECDKVTCTRLRHAHLHQYVIATLKTSFVTIRQYKAARTKASIAMGIDVAIRRICVERDLCAAPLDAILAEIKRCEIVHDDSSRTMSPACLPRSSAQVMRPPSLTTTTLSSPPSHTHPTSYLGAVLSLKGGDCKPSSHVLQATMAQESAAIMLHRTARRHKRPRRRPGRRNVPRAPNPADEAIPFHPLPTMGGTSILTTTHTKSASVNDRDPRLPMSSTSPPPMTLPSPSHTHPTSYLGVVLSPKGGDCKPSLHVLQATMAQESAAIMLHRMARQRKRPCCRPGRRNVYRAPNPADEAIPSHLLPMMGETSMPKTTDTKLGRANDRDPRLPMSSTSPPPMTLPSPSLQPFTIEGDTSTYSGGGFNDSFRDNGIILPPRKCPQQKHHPRRVCQCHSP